MEDASLDSVVCNLVLCTTPDPVRALREIARVLRPGGQLLFVEHVRADTPGWARWQERARDAWSAFACGCQLTRETLTTLRGKRARGCRGRAGATAHGSPGALVHLGPRDPAGLGG